MTLRGTISGVYSDLRPIVQCRIALVGSLTNDNLGGIPCRALVDTGATCVMITDRVVNELALQPVGNGTNFTAAGPVPVSEYRIDVAFDLVQSDGVALRFKVDNALAVCLPESEHHDIVLGMEVLHCFQMSFAAQQGPFSLIWQQTA